LGNFSVVHVLRSAVYGGVENHVLNLCKHGLERGMSVGLISLVNEPVAEEFKRIGIQVYLLNDSMAWSPRMAQSLLPLVRLLRTLKPDVVHLHGIRPTFLGSIAAVASGTKVIVSTLHGSYALMAMDHKGGLNKKLLWAAKLLHWIGFSLSGRVLLDCERLKDDVVQIYKGLTLDVNSVLKRKIRVVHNSIDLDQFLIAGDSLDRRSVGLPENGLVVGTVARLDEPKKGLGVLLEAMRQVAEVKANVHLAIVGEGWARDQLTRTTERLGLSDRVRFLGFQPDLPAVYRLFDIFVLPSFSEGFPTVNLEAMAACLPVITTDVGGAAEAVSEDISGYVVRPRDSAQLCEAILKLCNDKGKRTAMGKAGRELVEKHFSSKIMADKIFEVYREIA
jgi:glycosyltransferase involved in cell wall biosynthesis